MLISEWKIFQYVKETVGRTESRSKEQCHLWMDDQTVYSGIVFDVLDYSNKQNIDITSNTIKKKSLNLFQQRSLVQK